MKLTDLATGAALSNETHRTRGAAVEAAESPEMRARLESLERFGYTASAMVFAEVCEGREVTMREWLVEVGERAKRLREDHERTAAMRAEVAEAAAGVTLGTMRAACSHMENVAVTQKNERCLIWARGDTRPHRDELRALGFGWSREKQGWWIRPATA